MNDTVSWLLAGSVAGLALLTLGAAVDARAPAAHAIPPRPMLMAALQETSVEEPVERLLARALAESYFNLAKPGPEPARGLDDWYVRHEITRKGLAARAGTVPPPEELDENPSTLEAKALSAARETLIAWRRTLDDSVDHAQRGHLADLYGAAQARFDWWLLTLEAGADRHLNALARAHFEDALSALKAGAQNARLAAL